MLDKFGICTNFPKWTLWSISFKKKAQGCI
jgi:hypothetical protein